MSRSVKTSLLSLPNEVLSLIPPDPALLHSVTVGSSKTCSWRVTRFVGDATIDPLGATSLPRTRSLSEKEALTLKTLRALTHTCQRLRAVTLPVLWRVVHIDTVQELGKLRDQLRLDPTIGQYIRRFEFWWSMEDDCDSWPEELGTNLRLAFEDRGQVWDGLRKKWKCYVEEGMYGDSHFERNGVVYHQPGVRLYGDPPEDGDDAYDVTYDSEHIGRSGPDRHGKDRRIHSVADFEDALVEIVAQLSSLQAFQWRCNTSPMPVAVFNALQRLPKLDVLGLSLSFEKSETRIFPYWELASALSSLSIHDAQRESWNPNKPDNNIEVRIEPATEEDVASFELPSPPAKTCVELKALVPSVMCRMIVTAARGGNLKSLELLPERLTKYEQAFAIRALLPKWVRIEEWCITDNYIPPQSWVYAAWRLRFSLAHMSNVDASAARRLSCTEVQAMHAHFKDTALPTIKTPWSSLDAMERIKEGGPFDTYLTWLRDDAELAEQVADAWNDMVDRRQADVYRCYCKICDLAGAAAKA